MTIKRKDQGKAMNRQGGMIIRHVNETIMKVFEITEFTDILTIEE